MTDGQSEITSCAPRQRDRQQRSPLRHGPHQRNRAGFSVKRIWPCYADGAGAGRPSIVTWDKSPPAGARYRAISV